MTALVEAPVAAALAVWFGLLVVACLAYEWADRRNRRGNR